jgi:hypothetical protein
MRKAIVWLAAAGVVAVGGCSTSHHHVKPAPRHTATVRAHTPRPKPTRKVHHHHVIHVVRKHHTKK